MGREKEGKNNKWVRKKNEEKNAYNTGIEYAMYLHVRPKTSGKLHRWALHITRKYAQYSSKVRYVEQ